MNNRVRGRWWVMEVGSMGLSETFRAMSAVTKAVGGTVAVACTLTLAILGATAPSAGALPTSISDVGPASLSEGTGDPNLGVANQSGRTLNFDNGWRFKLVNTANATDPSGVYGDSSDPNAAAPDFPDSTWERVTLPHDWSITQLPSPSQTNATGYFPGGLGWYRKTFTLPASIKGKEITVDFDGVYDNSYVYLNGRLLGNHPYGYTGYSYDITGLAHTDGHTPNVLAVVVQNQEPSSRWYSGSGITRHVHLTVVDPVHIARWGTFVTTPNLATTIQSGYADVHVATQLANDTGTGKTTSIAYTVKDPSGRTVARGTSDPLPVPADGATGTIDLKVNHPHLWSTTDPALYTLQTQVISGHKQVDRASTTFGIRWLVFDPKHGHQPERQAAQAARSRPAQRRGRARLGRQLRRALAPDECA